MAVASVNWRQANIAVHDSLSALHKYVGHSEKARNVMHAFLNWFERLNKRVIVFGSNELTSWLLDGREPIKNVLNLINMLSAGVKKPLKQTFIGCGKHLTSWLIGIYEAQYLLVNDRKNKEALRIYLEDLKTECRRNY